MQLSTRQKRQNYNLPVTGSMTQVILVAFEYLTKYLTRLN